MPGMAEEPEEETIPKGCKSEAQRAKLSTFRLGQNVMALDAPSIRQASADHGCVPSVSTQLLASGRTGRVVGIDSRDTTVHGTCSPAVRRKVYRVLTR